MTYYLDTSALIRLLLEAHPSHEALVEYFDRNDVWTQVFSSDLLRLEAMRVAIRDRDEELRASAKALLQNMHLLDVTRGVLDAAAEIPVHVRSLDAIHIATAVREKADTVITYDLGMTSALRDHFGMDCVAP